MSDISLRTANCYCVELKKRRFAEEVVDSVARSRVSAEVLKKTRLQYRLSKFAWNDVFGDKTRDLLFRLHRIERGEEDPINMAVEMAFGWGKENQEKKQPGEEKNVKKAVLAPSTNFKAKRAPYGRINSLMGVQRALKQRATDQRKNLKKKEKEALQKKMETEMKQAYFYARQRQQCENTQAKTVDN